jgi:hypothetical protein
MIAGAHCHSELAASMHADSVCGAARGWHNTRSVRDVGVAVAVHLSRVALSCAICIHM